VVRTEPEKIEDPGKESLMSSTQKIARIEIIPIDIPFKRPFRVSYGAVVPGNFVVVRILTDAGVVGIGNSQGFTRGSGQTRESAMALMKEVASEVLLGQDPLNTDRLLMQVEGILAGSLHILAHFDYALYDLKGKILNVPVYQLLGGLSREKIPLEWIVMMDDPDVQAQVALKYIKAGFHSIKMHVGPDPKLAMKRFRTVREAIGPDVPLSVDMAGVYAPFDAARLIEEFAQYGIDFAEDPAPPDNIEALLAVKGRTSVPLVADRTCRSIIDLRELIKRRAADGFHLLMGKVGGLRKASKLSTLVEAAQLDYQICALGTGIEHAAGAHLAVSRTKGDRFRDELSLIFYLHDGMETKDITTDVTREMTGKIEKGYLYPPKGPGLGVELNDEMVTRYAASGVSKIVVK
jgi:L-alanine-DL-glutamate epimerase-like enolase superfamily enzyme